MFHNSIRWTSKVNGVAFWHARRKIIAITLVDPVGFVSIHLTLTLTPGYQQPLQKWGHAASINLCRHWSVGDFDPAELTFLPGWKCCVLALLNIIPKSPPPSPTKNPQKNTSFCQINQQNLADLCAPYVWLLGDIKCFWKLFQWKKLRMWWIASKRANGGTDFLLGDWNEVDQRPTSRNMSPFYSTSCYFFELHNINAMNRQEANWLISIYKIYNCTLRVDFNTNGWYHSGSQIHTLNIGTNARCMMYPCLPCGVAQEL